MVYFYLPEIIIIEINSKAYSTSRFDFIGTSGYEVKLEVSAL
jgi:hypothetical protein